MATLKVPSFWYSGVDVVYRGMFPSRLLLLSWLQYILPSLWYRSIKLHRNTSQKMVILKRRWSYSKTFSRNRRFYGSMRTSNGYLRDLRIKAILMWELVRILNYLLDWTNSLKAGFLLKFIKTSVSTLQETHHISVTKTSRLRLCKETIDVYCNSLDSSVLIATG
jgi:hypothetical protein